MSREEFLAQRDRWWLVTFDPTDDPTPPPLEADPRWVVPLAVWIGMTVWFILIGNIIFVYRGLWLH